jgi:hypothetical protein
LQNPCMVIIPTIETQPGRNCRTHAWWLYQQKHNQEETAELMMVTSNNRNTAGRPQFFSPTTETCASLWNKLWNPHLHEHWLMSCVWWLFVTSLRKWRWGGWSGLVRFIGHWSSRNLPSVEHCVHGRIFMQRAYTRR